MPPTLLLLITLAATIREAVSCVPEYDTLERETKCCAFWCTKWQVAPFAIADNTECQHLHEGNARNVHATFLKAFGLTRDTGPPLIVLDLADGVGQPFVLAN